jgi:hypothetical protein
VTERLATRLLLISRDAASGRLRNPKALDVGLRAGLFVDLLRGGFLISDEGAPAVADTAPTGDRLLDAVRDAVGRRPRVSWRRWYRHVHVDQVACVGELLESGRWVGNPGPLVRYTDTESDAALVAWQHTIEVLDLHRQPDDGPDAALAILASLSGATGGLRRSARAIDRELASLMTMLDPDPQIALDLRNCLRAAARSTRRTLPRWLVLR